jgi:hypothetical protein
MNDTHILIRLLWMYIPRNWEFGLALAKLRNFGGGGVQQIQLRIEGTENGDLGAVAPYSGVPLNLQMSEPRILIRLLRMYIPRNWEFGSALEKLRNFGGGEGVEPQTSPPSVRPYVSESLFNRKELPIKCTDTFKH